MAEVYTRACPAYGYGHGIIWGRLERPFFLYFRREGILSPAIHARVFPRRLLPQLPQAGLNCDLIRNIVVKYSGYILIWIALQLNFSAEDAEAS